MPISPVLLQQVANPPYAGQVNPFGQANISMQLFQKQKNAELAEKQFMLEKEKHDAEYERIAREDLANEQAEQTYFSEAAKLKASKKATERMVGELMEKFAFPGQDAEDYVKARIKALEMGPELYNAGLEHIEANARVLSGMNDEELVNHLQASAIDMDPDTVRTLARGAVLTEQAETQAEIQKRAQIAGAETTAREAAKGEQAPELAAADSNAMQRATATLFGGSYNPLTGQFSMPDLQDKTEPGRIQARAEQIFLERKASGNPMGHASAVMEAFEEIKGEKPSEEAQASAEAAATEESEPITEEDPLAGDKVQSGTVQSEESFDEQVTPFIQDTERRFAADPTLPEGASLGPFVTGKGFQVLDAQGNVIGFYN